MDRLMWVEGRKEKGSKEKGREEGRKARSYECLNSGEQADL